LVKAFSQNNACSLLNVQIILKVCLFDMKFKTIPNHLRIHPV
jgi:hypothetical protein